MAKPSRLYAKGDSEQAIAHLKTDQSGQGFQFTLPLVTAMFTLGLYVMSPCPGRIKREIPIALPEYLNLEVKLSPEFVALKRRVIHELHDDRIDL